MIAFGMTKMILRKGELRIVDSRERSVRSCDREGNGKRWVLLGRGGWNWKEELIDNPVSQCKDNHSMNLIIQSKLSTILPMASKPQLHSFLAIPRKLT